MIVLKLRKYWLGLRTDYQYLAVAELHKLNKSTMYAMLYGNAYAKAEWHDFCQMIMMGGEL